MLILRGASALSSFRCEKLLARLRKVATVKSVYAEYVHFADLADELTPEHTSVLELLLHYGPRQADLFDAQSLTPSSQLFLVIPRPGTISPWASKATNIAHNCGLANIHGKTLRH